MRTIHPHEILLLRILTCSVFAGRAWQHIFWDIPIRAFAWDENLFKTPIETLTRMTWNEYVTSMTADAWLQGITQALGVLCIACAIAAWLIRPHTKWLGILLKIGGGYLILLFLMYWKERFQSSGMFIEHTIQWATPFMLVYAVIHQKNTATFRFWIKVAIALTFIGHGLYAFGYYPVPGNFTEMMVSVFGLSDSTALWWLKVAGVVDFIAAAALFIPRIVTPAIWYCIVWGTITAFARIVSNFTFDLPLDSLHQWLHETIFRLPHGGIPLLLLWLIKKE